MNAATPERSAPDPAAVEVGGNRWRAFWPAIIVLAVFVGLLLLSEFGVMESYKIDFPAELFD